jgi:hypothetical protein
MRGHTVKKLEIVFVFALPRFLTPPLFRAPSAAVLAAACGIITSDTEGVSERTFSIAWTAGHLLIGHLLREHCC